MNIPIPKPKKKEVSHYKKCGYCKELVHMDKAWIKYASTNKPPYKVQKYYHPECYEKSIGHAFPSGVCP